MLPNIFWSRTDYISGAYATKIVAISSPGCRAYGCRSVSVGLIFPLFLSVVWICRLELATHHGALCVCQPNPPLAVRYYELWRSEWLRDRREDTVLPMQHVLDRVERAELGGCVQVRGGNGMF